MKKKLIVKVPKDMMKTVAGVTFFCEKEGRLFFQSEKEGKVIPNEDLILQHKKAHGMYVVVQKDHFRSAYSVSLKEMRTLLKVMESRKKYFEKLAKQKKNLSLKGAFFIHFSPDLSFFIKE